MRAHLCNIKSAYMYYVTLRLAHNLFFQRIWKHYKTIMKTVNELEVSMTLRVSLHGLSGVPSVVRCICVFFCVRAGSRGSRASGFSRTLSHHLCNTLGEKESTCNEEAL